MTILNIIWYLTGSQSVQIFHHRKDVVKTWTIRELPCGSVFHPLQPNNTGQAGNLKLYSGLLQQSRHPVTNAKNNVCALC